jgi:RNA polymerase sigma-70 factor (ECF subfamily)
MTRDLGDPRGFRQAFAAHHRTVYAAAFGVLGDAAAAQDVVQDVFLRLWRRPDKFDAQRGDLATYLRLMGRSRAVDLWREGQVRGRAAPRR